MENSGRCFNNKFSVFEDALKVAGLLEALDMDQALSSLADVRSDFLSAEARDVATILQNMRDVLSIVMQHQDTHSTYVLRHIALQACILLMPEIDECKPFPSAIEGFNDDFIFNKYRKDSRGRAWSSGLPF